MIMRFIYSALLHTRGEALIQFIVANTRTWLALHICGDSRQYDTSRLTELVADVRIF